MPVLTDRIASVDTASPAALPLTATDPDLPAEECVGAEGIPEPHGRRCQRSEVESMRHVADLFTALADTTRLQIIHALAQSELCVTEICTALNMKQSAVSHQLRVMRSSRMVKCRRAGRLMFYSLEDDRIYHLYVMGLVFLRG